MGVVVYVYHSITKELLEQEDCKFKTTPIYIANPPFSNSRKQKGDEKKSRWFVKMSVFWLFIKIMWYTEVQNQNNPADGLLLVCTADVHWLRLLPLLPLLQLFHKRLQLKENIWEHEIFEVTWHYCWVTQGLSTCRQRSPGKGNFLTKHWPFFFFDPIDVNIMRFYHKPVILLLLVPEKGCITDSWLWCRKWNFLIDCQLLWHKS